MQRVLQRADGTYVGTAVIETNGFPLQSMVAFTLSGQLLWSQTNYVPQIATSGGGIIATSLDGSTTATFDANGNQTGKAPTLSPPSSQSSTGQWPSWLGNVLGASYATTSGAAALIASAPIGYAATYAAVPGGNHGGTGTSAQQEWYPELPSCPGASTPCAKEAVQDALLRPLDSGRSCLIRVRRAPRLYSTSLEATSGSFKSMCHDRTGSLMARARTLPQKFFANQGSIGRRSVITTTLELYPAL
jgi:hypothetical protein